MAAVIGAGPLFCCLQLQLGLGRGNIIQLAFYHGNRKNMDHFHYSVGKNLLCFYGFLDLGD